MPLLANCFQTVLCLPVLRADKGPRLDSGFALVEANFERKIDALDVQLSVDKLIYLDTCRCPDYERFGLSSRVRSIAYFER